MNDNFFRWFAVSVFFYIIGIFSFLLFVRFIRVDNQKDNFKEEIDHNTDKGYYNSGYEHDLRKFSLVISRGFKAIRRNILYFTSIIIIIALFVIFINVRNSNADFRRKYNIERANVYNDVIDVCSEIATQPRDTLFNDGYYFDPLVRANQKKFISLYLGRLNLYADTAVLNATHEFYIQMNDSTRQNIQLKVALKKIALACRKALQVSYGIDEYGYEHRDFWY